MRSRRPALLLSPALAAALGPKGAPLSPAMWAALNPAPGMVNTVGRAANGALLVTTRPIDAQDSCWPMVDEAAADSMWGNLPTTPTPLDPPG